MLLHRLAPEGFFAVTAVTEAVAESGSATARLLHSDPFETPPADWELGRTVEIAEVGGLLAPVWPRKIVGIGRNYKDHAAELGNPMPKEPLIFLKAPTSLIGPGSPVVLPPESQRVEFEGEIAVVIGGVGGQRLTRASHAQARAAILGVTAAVDVTARDIQKSDATFARGKSFDTFCPVGPAIAVDGNGQGGLDPLDLDALEVVTRVNGTERQRGVTSQMAWGIVDLVVYVSRFMSLEPGDLILTGTPAGVGSLSDGDRIQVEVSGVGVLDVPVEARVDGIGHAEERVGE